LAGLLGLALAALACRSAAPGPAAQPAANAPVAPGPWGLVASDLASQRLYRVQVQRRGDDASLRVVLRLAAVGRFELTAADALGRKLWALTVDDGRGRWVAGGGARACRFDSGRALRFTDFDWGLPASHLAAALAGRLPEPPTDSNEAESIAFVDGAGRSWSALRDGRGPLRWRLALGGGGELVWERRDRGGELTADGGEIRVRWSEVAREPLAGEGPHLAADDREPECDDADLS